MLMMTGQELIGVRTVGVAADIAFWACEKRSAGDARRLLYIVCFAGVTQVAAQSTALRLFFYVIMYTSLKIFKYLIRGIPARRVEAHERGKHFLRTCSIKTYHGDNPPLAPVRRPYMFLHKCKVIM
jgi:hypothetical protein